MTHQWDPQKTLEPSLALELIQEQFPQLGVQKIKLIGAGWDNTAFLVNEEWIFRFPRREIAIALLEAEWNILPQLAPHLSLPIPIPVYRGSPTARFSWPFVGYKMLLGVTACSAYLSEEERHALAKPIAQFLSKLHALPRSLLSGCQLPEDKQMRIDAQLLRPKIKKNLEELAALDLLNTRNRLEALIDHLENLRAPLTNTLVHGDFYVRHLLVNEKHALTGIIDWGDIHRGDPAIDLSIAHSFLPASAHSLFREAYGEITEETWSLARFRAIYSCTLLALYGYHSKDVNILREGIRSLNVIANT